MTVNEFMSEWEKIKGLVFKADALIVDGKNPGRVWKQQEKRKKNLVQIWHNEFRNKIRATVCNNTNPENYLQFLDFKKI